MYILGIFLAILVSTSLLLHGIFAALGCLPSPKQAILTEREFFNVDYTLFMNAVFALVTIIFLALTLLKKKEAGTEHMHHHKHAKRSAGEKVLQGFAVAAILWLGGGLLAKVLF
jgi:fucose permease